MVNTQQPTQQTQETGEPVPLAEFMGYFTGGKFGVDGMLNLDIRVNNDEKYNALALTDFGGQILKIVVYAPFGEGPENTPEQRKAYLARILEGLPINGQMGDGAGAPRDDNNRLKEGYQESERVDTGMIHGRKRTTRRVRGDET